MKIAIERADNNNGESIKSALALYAKNPRFLLCGKYKIDLWKRPRVMGVLNVTPDSFSDAGVYFDKGLAVERALRMEEEGADIIDIGAQSTRPGSNPVSAKEQFTRIKEIVKVLGKRLKIPISIDTTSSIVSEYCLDMGASIINDISALRNDRKLAHLVAKYKAGIVLMHMQKTPRNMQVNPEYRDLITEIIDFLKKAKDRALKAGIEENRIILDPGIGFGKTTEHNLKIIKFLSRFKALGQPLLIGTSRKSFIGNVLGLPVTEREFGTAASVAISVLNGARIVRVHNVKQMREVLDITWAIIRQEA